MNNKKNKIVLGKIFIKLRVNQRFSLIHFKWLNQMNERRKSLNILEDWKGHGANKFE